MPSTITEVDPVVLRHALPVVVVHTALRREFRLAGRLVRQVAVGDGARAELVGGHLDILFRQLHHHHGLEDDFVWPLLRERATESIVPVIDVMQAQHAEIDRLVRSGESRLPVWRVGAGADARDRLAELLDDLHGRLIEHLDLEEQVVLPLAEQHLLAAEWEQIGRHANESIPRPERALSFGMLHYEGDPTVLASMLRSAPPPVRWLVPRLARRAYRRHVLAVHGTPTP